MGAERISTWAIKGDGDPVRAWHSIQGTISIAIQALQGGQAVATLGLRGTGRAVCHLIPARVVCVMSWVRCVVGDRRRGARVSRGQAGARETAGNTV